VFKNRGGHLLQFTFFLKIFILNSSLLTRIGPDEDPKTPSKVPVRTSSVTSVILRVLLQGLSNLVRREFRKDSNFIPSRAK
jgi:hypothetical protein